MIEEKTRLKNLIKSKIDNINKTYEGLSQDYKDGVDEGLKVALWILIEEQGDSK